MNIITQKFEKYAKKIIFSLNNKEIRSILHRDRLKFSYDEILYYVKILFSHSLSQRSFKYYYKHSKLQFTYQNYIKNIQLFSLFFRFIFYKINKILFIKVSSIYNIVDTTLIEEKKTENLTKKDWDLHRVTTRIKSNKKIHIIGEKGLVFINKKKQIYCAELLPINTSDQNILKIPAVYCNMLKGVLLADRGFSNKEVRNRLKSFQNSIFNPKKELCRLISPYQYKEKIQLTEKERKLYKKRWQIETVFQKIKHNYSESPLNLKGKYTKKLKIAKFYSTIISYNLSTI